jgi:hypothetical protein
MLKKVKLHMEIETLKSLTYEQINEVLNKVYAKNKRLQNECTKTKVCHWTIEDEEASTWSGDCGVVWYFPDGATPKDSCLNYCPRCGGIVLIDGCPVMGKALAGGEE